jgi:hypothetical protein
METINKLIRGKIPFAVICSFNLAKAVPDWHTEDWFIITDRRKYDKVKKLGFSKMGNNKKVLERSLSKLETRQFRQQSDNYNMILSNEYGRVYELKGTNFKNTLL